MIILQFIPDCSVLAGWFGVYDEQIARMQKDTSRWLYRYWSRLVFGLSLMKGRQLPQANRVSTLCAHRTFKRRRHCLAEGDCEAELRVRLVCRLSSAARVGFKVCVVASATRIGAHLRICTHDEQKGAARRMRVRDALRTERRHRLPMLMMIVLASARAEGDSRAAAAEAPGTRAVAKV
eukprot:6194030-Pleurochrysis_carterae.AAC.1